MFARGTGRAEIFGDDSDRSTYLGLLGGVVVHWKWRCLAYCLMPNHVHVLIELREPTLSVGMQRLHGTYARDFNERYDRRGHVFESRFGSVAIRDDAQLLTVLHYIAANPVKAGLCADERHWPWSSHGAVSRGAAPRWLDHARVREYLAGWATDLRIVYDSLAEAA